MSKKKLKDRKGFRSKAQSDVERLLSDLLERSPEDVYFETSDAPERKHLKSPKDESQTLYIASNPFSSEVPEDYGEGE